MAMWIKKAIEYMISRNFYGMNANNKPNKQECLPYIHSEQRKAPSSGTLIQNAEDTTLHLDMCGPFDVVTYEKVSIS